MKEKIHQSLVYNDNLIHSYIENIFSKIDYTSIPSLDYVVTCYQYLKITLESIKIILQDINLLENIDEYGNTLVLFVKIDLLNNCKLNSDFRDAIIDLVENHGDIQTLASLYNSIKFFTDKVILSLREVIFELLPIMKQIRLNCIQIPRNITYEIFDKIYQDDYYISLIQEYDKISMISWENGNSYLKTENLNQEVNYIFHQVYQYSQLNGTIEVSM